MHYIIAIILIIIIFIYSLIDPSGFIEYRNNSIRNIFLFIIGITIFLNWENIKEYYKKKKQEDIVLKNIKKEERARKKEKKEKLDRNSVSHLVSDLDINIKNKKEYRLEYLKNIKISKGILRSLNKKINLEINRRIIRRRDTNLININNKEYESKIILEDADSSSSFLFAILSIQIEKNKVLENSKKWIDFSIEDNITKFDVFISPSPTGDLTGSIKRIVSISNLRILFEDWIGTIEDYNSFEFMNEIKETTSDIQSEIDRLDEKEIKKIEDEGIVNVVDKMIKLKKIENEDISKLSEDFSNKDITIKQKIKLSIPLFLFLRYEAEMEILGKKSLPKSLKEIRNLIIKNI